MKNAKMKKTRLLRIMILAFIMVVACVLPAFADVTTTTSTQGDSKRICIAGNPNFYPYEYYDPDKGEYCGVFPEIYKIISNETDMSFEYIDAGTNDLRLLDAKTGYAEIISAYVFDDEEMSNFRISESIPIIEYGGENGNVTIGIAFGPYASEKTVQKMTEALGNISDETIASLIAETLNSESKGYDAVLYICIIAFLAIMLLAAIVIIIYNTVKRNDRKEREQRKEFKDQLTGIGNKRFFIKEFKKIVAYQYKASYVIGYIAFDITRVNKYYGEQKAEEQLCYAANILTSEGKNKEITARVAGGAFAVMHVCSTEKEAKEWAHQLVERLNVYSIQFKRDFAPKFKIGVYRLKTGNWDAEKALKNAHKCYDLAASSDSDVFISNAEMEQQDAMNEILSHDVAAALNEGQIEQHLQPIVDAETKQIIGAESLSRWNHPRMGLLRPARFIEMMIDEGKIIELDMYIFEKTCQKLESWAKEGKQYKISTNFTRFSISSLDFLDRIRAISNRYSFPHYRLIIEITEDSLTTNREESLHNMNECKKMGFRIALDDLGSGYTFFSDLKDYPLDIIKMDRSLLLDAEDEKGRVLMQGIIRVCRELGMEIICEGVETNTQYELVKSMGCDQIQGYYFYSVLAPDEVDKFMV